MNRARLDIIGNHDTELLPSGPPPITGRGGVFFLWTIFRRSLWRPQMPPRLPLWSRVPQLLRATVRHAKIRKPTEELRTVNTHFLRIHPQQGLDGLLCATQSVERVLGRVSFASLQYRFPFHHGGASPSDSAVYHWLVGSYALTHEDPHCKGTIFVQRRRFFARILQVDSWRRR